MSEFGKILNSAIDAAQELAGDMKAATDKMIDTAQEQAPSVVASAREKRQALTDRRAKIFRALSTRRRMRPRRRWMTRKP